MVTVKRVKRKLRVVGALPTHKDRAPFVPVDRRPEIVAEKRRAELAAIFERAAVAMHSFGLQMPRFIGMDFAGLEARTLEQASQLYSQLSARRQGRSESVQFGRILRSAGFTELRGVGHHRTLADQLALARDNTGVNVNPHTAANPPTLYGVPVIAMPDLPAGEIAFLDTEASFPPSREFLEAIGRSPSVISFDSVPGSEGYLVARSRDHLSAADFELLRSRGWDIANAPFDRRHLELPIANRSVRNDEKQRQAPHARFLAENERFSRRGRRR